MSTMKKLIESVDAGMAEGPMGMAPDMPPRMPMPPEDKGNPVSVNVTMNASGKEHVADLLDMMKNAGLGGAEEVTAKSLGPRMDMEKFRSIVDSEPEAEDEVDEITAKQKKLPPELQKAIKDKEDEEGDVDEWANSAPGEEPEDRGTLGDYEDNIHDGNDLHRKKDRSAIRTVNPALESIKEDLYKMLAEKKAKPDFLDLDGDENTKEPMKKAAKDKKAKKVGEAEEGKMPSKAHIMKMCKDGKTKAEICKMHPDCDQGKLKAMIDDCQKEMKDDVKEGAFKKAGSKGDGSKAFDEAGCTKEMKKLDASGCAKHEMFDKVAEKYGCSKANFEKLYASNCG
tara:strand:- start:5821 stop:6840 length:1020 start_codon:yes stop_codon:yes gene_type:complete